jgi:hypothetical protein
MEDMSNTEAWAARNRGKERRTGRARAKLERSQSRVTARTSEKQLDIANAETTVRSRERARAIARGRGRATAKSRASLEFVRAGLRASTGTTRDKKGRVSKTLNEIKSRKDSRQG